jgi:hypothetical protein
VNNKVYIHETIDIIGHNRAAYLYHVSANYSPIAQEKRNQLCFGIWGVVGTTKKWPEAIILWEEDGFEGMARAFRDEFDHPNLEDPELEKWEAEAAVYRSGGVTRRLVPAPWTRTIEELCADGVRGEAYAHERVTTQPGRSLELLELVRDRGALVYQKFGWELVGAWETAMVDDSECWLLWAIPRWEHWADFEKAQRRDKQVLAWRDDARQVTTSWYRFLMAESPLSPLRTGRQPRRDDRLDDWQE